MVSAGARATNRMRAFTLIMLVGMLCGPLFANTPLGPVPEASAAPNLVSPTGTRMIAPGKYRVYATREGLVGGMTSSGWIIQEHDYFVSLPSCTTTNCPGGNYFGGNKTECGDRCYVRVINTSTGACRVEPVKDTGPWFRVDDWWGTTSARYLNRLSTNPNKPIPQGMTGADLARGGYDVGFGKSGSIGSSDRYDAVGNPAAIDIADGTWYDLKLNAADRVGSMVEAHMLWQTGESPAAAAKACGHPLNQASGNIGTTVDVSVSASSGKVGDKRTVSDAPNPVTDTVIFVPGGPSLGVLLRFGSTVKRTCPSLPLSAPTAAKECRPFFACGISTTALKVPVVVAVTVAIGEVVVESQ